MLELHTLDFFFLVRMCSQLEIKLERYADANEFEDDPDPMRVDDTLDMALKDFARHCANLQMPVTQDALENCHRKLINCAGGKDDKGYFLLSPQEAGVVGGHAREALDRLRIEARQKTFLAIDPQNVQYMDQNAGMFGEAVDMAFPDSIGDISEAGKCYALGRYTAAVFHLMRAVESTLPVLATRTNAVVENANGETLPWGILVSNLKDKIDVMPASHMKDEWCKIHALLHSVNRAYRTKTAHPKTTYTQEEALNVLSATKSFMQHLEAVMTDQSIA